MASNMCRTRTETESPCAKHALVSSWPVSNAEQLPIPAAVLEPDYFERAYQEGADEQDV